MRGDGMTNQVATKSIELPISIAMIEETTASA